LKALGAALLMRCYELSWARPGITSPSQSSTCACVLTFSPPKVKQLAEMIGNARNGGFSIGRHQCDFSGDSPRRSPVELEGLNSPVSAGRRG
jgi:hypothetical protein